MTLGGGNLIVASVPNFKKDYRRFLEYLSTQMRELGVTVELRREVTPEQIIDTRPDVVFIATGSIPVIPEIPGMERANVITAIDSLLDKKEPNDPITVIGGGLIGCETVLHLAQEGN